ncbi:MAG: transcription-repair coupling factor [Chloroflexi bacterium]|nr:transcription-repair coupling factor [Chloroflexota bacterium]
MRHFDPLTQVSHERTASVTLPPAGELGILKRLVQDEAQHAKPQAHEPTTAADEAQPPTSGSKADLLRVHTPACAPTDKPEARQPAGGTPAPPSASATAPADKPALLAASVLASDSAERLATLLDYLPPDTLFLICEPEAILEHADSYAGQVPSGDPFFISWPGFQDLMRAQNRTVVEIAEAKTEFQLIKPPESTDERPGAGWTPALPEFQPAEPPKSVGMSKPCPDLTLNESAESARVWPVLDFPNLDAYRPLAERAPEPLVAEAQRREFFAQLHRWQRQGYQVHVLCNNEGERERFREIWAEYGLGETMQTTGVKGGEREGEGVPGSLDARLSTQLGVLARGFFHDAAKVVVVTDAEIFGRYKVQRPRRLKSPHALAARSALDIDFTDLQEGDFVVHLQHGIGQYLGLQVLPAGLGRKHVKQPEAAGDIGQECLVIEYAPSDPDQPPPKLYVPVTEAHLVSKYVGAGKARPVLNALGGKRWAKTKAQAVSAVRDLASELLAIQAARASQPGHAFAPDTPWQREFESAFIYEETPDQMRAIVETKRDLELPRPMDRLICGDVGYGKTEVAIRAAFKSVMGGKQVAILVPTTILAQQHFNTFRERTADYPVRVEQLSRFCSRRDQGRIVRQLAEGSIDIVIGTHRLLQDDVGFKDLGLVVIDEEQRFGVMHKEKFKLLRKLVDVLTLSATPIPRTLYLALTGARDMSTIETPPQDRLPVETIVAQYDERLIRDAIQRELNREGQVYFLHNRVADIENVALRVRSLVPDARVIVGHGQMESDDLEEVMATFINGQADVLVSTTIIESGIDIPNANTIIINRADRFGLSDLYQLRGRVGRYKHQAHAYLLLPRHATLLSDVRRRISAIKQYSSLGSGFKIAMRDLEIRGAGNLLGPEQSGHITAVGFELYCQLLKQSISALKGEKVRPQVEVQVRLDFLAMNPEEETKERRRTEGRGRRTKDRKQKTEVEIAVPREVMMFAEEAEFEIENPKSEIRKGKAAAYIPLQYIAEPQQRIEIYRKLAQATDAAALDRLRDELRDRFGKIPPAVELLLQVADLKVLAGDRGVAAIETRDDKLMLTRNNDYLMPGGKFPRLSKKEPQARLNEIRRLLLAL